MIKEDLKESPLSDEQTERFMNKALARAGAETMVTPREIIRDYLTLLNILRDNKNASFENLMEQISFKDSPTATDDRSEEAVPAPKAKISIFDIDI